MEREKENIRLAEHRACCPQDMIHAVGCVQVPVGGRELLEVRVACAHSGSGVCVCVCVCYMGVCVYVRVCKLGKGMLLRVCARVCASV